MPEPSNVGTFWKDADTEDPQANGHPAFIPGLNDRETAFRDWISEVSTQATISAKTADYTLALADAGAAIEVDSAGAVTITIPAEATVDFPVGAWVEIDRLGAGTVTIAAAAGVTLRSAGGLVDLRAQYSGATVRKRGADDWLLVGDLA